MEISMQSVLKLRDSFMLLVHVSMRKSTWEEKAINHQWTKWPVALAFLSRLNSSVDFLMSHDSRVMRGGCVRGFLTCISLFACVCFLEFVRLLVSARMQRMSMSVCECLQMLVALGCVSTHHRKHHQHIVIYARAGRISTRLEEKQFHTTHLGLQHSRLRQH